MEVFTQAYQDQKPGTSGLRKKVSVFEQPNYTENFIQSILKANSIPKTLVVGGDGRYYSEEAIKKIINICAANEVQRLIVAKDGILSTPAASALIRARKADGGIILTASHNLGGKDGDFGIKYNIANGGPAPESVTDKIYEVSKSLSSYLMLFKKPQINLKEIHLFSVQNLQVEVVDPVENYANLLRELFDFDKIRNKFQEQKIPPFKVVIDPMNGVMGPYVKKILIEELCMPESSLINAEPLPDFGGKHPDPNLTYAKDLVKMLTEEGQYEFGVAFDGDGDRNMILGQEAFFVSPGDSLAIIGAQMAHIKYFANQGATGFARSFPTAPAIDRVAKKLGLKCYETPTGWKYFGNLMDSNLISLCGEESFGTGSNHIREKDGLWACLAWLSIMANTGKSVRELIVDHWKEFGRDYFCRFDFEDCDATRCAIMMKELETLLCGKSLIGKKYGENDRYVVKSTGNFEYTDPVDQTVTSKQGLFIKFDNGARIVFRLSGTGSCGATVRLYVSDYSKEEIQTNSREYLKELLDVAYEVSKLPTHISRFEPTVVT